MSNPSTVLVFSADPLIEMVVRHLLPVEQYAVRRIVERAEVGPLLEQEARLAVLDLPEMDALTLTFVRDLHAGAGKPLIVLTNEPAQLAGQVEPAVRLLGRPPQLDQLQAALNAALAEPTPPAAPAGPPAGQNHRRLVSLVGLAVLAVAAVVLLGPMLGVPGLPNVIERYFGKKEEAEKVSSESVTLFDGQPNAFELPAGVVAKMKIPKSFEIQEVAQPRIQTFSGTLAFDPDRMVRIQSRFPGEVIALGTTDGKPIEEDRSDHRSPTLAAMNRVKEGQQMAVVWSSALGDKKSDLLDALSQYNLASEDVKKLTEIENSISQAVLRAARTKQEQTRVLVERAERALKTWKVSDEEIKAIRKEAEILIKRRGKEDPLAELVRQRNWARVEIPSPIAGVIVEKNVPNKPTMVDTTQTLFIVADLTSLLVYIHVYEEDLPELMSLIKASNSKPVPWDLYLTYGPRQRLTSPGLSRLGPIIDPNQHTNIAVGSVSNKDRRLSVGQFVTAEVKFPAPKGVVSIPIGALDEDGATSSVLVQLDPDHYRYQLRRVGVVQRFLDFAYVKSELDESERAAGLSALKPGDLVVTGGAVQLKPALEEAQARKKAEERSEAPK